MQQRKITEAAYLTADNHWRYRMILRYFYIFRNLSRTLGKAVEAYYKGYIQKFLVTGEISPTGVKHFFGQY